MNYLHIAHLFDARAGDDALDVDYLNMFQLSRSESSILVELIFRFILTFLKRKSLIINIHLFFFKFW